MFFYTYSLSICNESPALPTTYVARQTAGRKSISRAKPLDPSRHKKESKAAGRGGWSKLKRKVVDDDNETDCANSKAPPLKKRRRHADAIMASQCLLTDADSRGSRSRKP